MICGIDEAGRGPVIGPLVIAGVNFKDDSILIKNNVRDSKTISPNRRKELANIIKENALNYVPLYFCLNIVKSIKSSPIKINLFACQISTQPLNRPGAYS